VNISKLILNTTLSFSTFIFIGCGGGSGPSIPTQPTPIPPPPVVNPNPVAGIDYTDPSQFMQTTVIPTSLLDVNTQVAHNNGFTGGNLSSTTSYTTVVSDVSNRNLQTIVAVLDSGVNASHEDLNSTGKIIGWKDLTSTNSATPFDTVGHGTFVNDIIAGNRNNVNDGYYGIAYGAKLLDGKIITNDETTDNIILQNGIDWVASQKTALDITNVQKLVSLNLSLGSTDSAFVSGTFQTSLLNLLNKDVTVVVAAGNEGLNCLPDINGNINGQCSFPAAAPWVNSASTNSYLHNNGGWIVVGSVDSNNNISSFSNKAGVSKSNYIVAPGENIIAASNTVNNGYMIGSGTSFAAPIVSGAIALMAQKWPYLTGRQYSQILFDTATDLGTPGIDDVYGNGLLNLTKAFEPVGTIIIPSSLSNVNLTTFSGSPIGVTKLKTSSSMISLNSLTQLNDTVGIDSYNRDYKLNLTNSIYNDGSSSVDFDHYITFNINKFLIGYDQYKLLPMIGYKYNNDNKIRLSFDNKTLFGMESDGAFKTKNSYTSYLNYENNIREGENILLTTDLTYGYGNSETSDESLIKNISSVHALGGSIKASYDGLGVGYKIPLRTIKGDMTFNTPTGIDYNGNIIYNSFSTKLSPNSFEQTYSLFYNKNLNDFYVFAELSHTIDAFGIKNYIDNEAKLSLNYYY
jgi:subtilisin family serine protease